MKVSELAQRTGVSTHRLRRYEEQGLIRAERNSSGYREFSEHTVREVTFIDMGRDLGFSLDDLAEVLPRYRSGQLGIDEMLQVLHARIAAVDALIAEQRALRRRLVDHVGWFKHRQRAAAARKKTPPPSTWPTTRKAKQ